MIPFTGNEKESHSGRKQIVPAGAGWGGGGWGGEGERESSGGTGEGGHNGLRNS